MDTSSGVLALLFLATAFLYASVGHAGASGYLAAMALLGISSEIMKPTALALNLVVATITTGTFYRAGHFSWPRFWPFALPSVPFAFAGGAVELTSWLYQLGIGLVLLLAALQLLRTRRAPRREALQPLPRHWAMLAGVVIGFVSGLTGVGGGIFLSALLILSGWSETRQTSALAAAFILLNSLAGLLGHLSSVGALPAALPLWALAVAIGGWLGAQYGSRRFSPVLLQRLLAIVLLIASVKMILG